MKTYKIQYRLEETGVETVRADYIHPDKNDGGNYLFYRAAGVVCAIIPRDIVASIHLEDNKN